MGWLVTEPFGTLLEGPGMHGIILKSHLSIWHPKGAGIASAGRDGDILCSWLCCGDHWPSRWMNGAEIEISKWCWFIIWGQQKKGSHPLMSDEIQPCLSIFVCVCIFFLWLFFWRQLSNFDCCLISWPRDKNISCALICWRVHLEGFSFSGVTSVIRIESVTATYIVISINYFFHRVEVYIYLKRQAAH